MLDAWHHASACADPKLSPDIWFDDADTARRICARCPVRDACLSYVLKVERESGESLLGVWGGLSPIQRRRLAANPDSLERMRRVRSKTRVRPLPPRHPVHATLTGVQLTLIPA